MKNEKVLHLFPWVEMIPLVLDMLAFFFATTPNNVLYSMGLQEFVPISIVLAAVSSIIFACLGFAVFRQLQGLKKIITLVLSLFYAVIVCAMWCGIIFFFIQLFSGNISV